LKSVYDTDYNKIMSMWSSNDPTALAPDQIAMELRHSGVIIEEENPVDILVKINTLYRGKDSYSEMIDTTPIDVIRAGYRAGEIFSPILAAQITSEVRIQIAKAARAMKTAGGVPVVAMTDTMTWIGTKEMLPTEMMREKKTVGFFEAPKLVKQFTCLGTGRYSYTDEKGEMTSKRRGLNNAEIHDPNGIIIDDFDWMEALHIAIQKKSENIEIGVRVLVSVGLVETQSQYTFEDLGRVVNDVRTVDLIAGKTKRIFPPMIHDFDLLSHSMIETSPIILGFDHHGNINDQTLPVLLEVLEMIVEQLDLNLFLADLRIVHDLRPLFFVCVNLLCFNVVIDFRDDGERFKQLADGRFLRGGIGQRERESHFATSTRIQLCGARVTSPCNQPILTLSLFNTSLRTTKSFSSIGFSKITRSVMCQA